MIDAITKIRRKIAAGNCSIDDAVAMVEHCLPGWGWRVAACSVSDDAWLFPDFNCPKHGARLRQELIEDVDWVELTDVDLRPPGHPGGALLQSLLKALGAMSVYRRDPLLGERMQ
jgi:hypothetical protein